MINLIIETLQYAEDDLKSVQKVAKTYPIVSTKFPDGTSQAWQLPEDAIEDLSDAYCVTIDWRFKEERELFDLVSLWALLTTEFKPHFSKPRYVIDAETSKHLIFTDHSVPFPIYLNVPYFPFARQDKEISNISTFNLKVFFEMFNAMLRFPVVPKHICNIYKPPTITAIRAFDPHSNAIRELFLQRFEAFRDFKPISPESKFSPESSHTFEEFVNYMTKWDMIIYPDESAERRYSKSKVGREEAIPELTIVKTRDYMTGEITGSTFSHESIENALTYFEKFDKNVLVIDDICDGGATFIKCAALIKEANPNLKRLGLRVSHGIFSKGLKPLKDAGYTDIFYTDSLDPSFDKEIPEGLNVVKFKL